MALTAAQVIIAVQAQTGNAVSTLQSLASQVNTFAANLTGLGSSAASSLGTTTNAVTQTAAALTGLGNTGVASISAVSQSTNILTSFMERATERAIGWAAAMTGLRVIEGIFQGMKSVIVDFNSEMEMASVSWEVLLKSATLAQGMLQELQQFAARTIFTFPGVEMSARQLMGFGFQAKEILPLIKDIGSVASLSGKNAEMMFDRIAYAIGQIRNEGRVLAQDLHQLIQAGVEVDRIYAIIGQTTGKTIEQVRTLQKEGKLSSDVFIEAFQTFVRQNYGDIMEKQSKTFAVATANIMDQVRITFGQGFEPGFKRISELAVRISDFVSSDEFHSWGASIAGVIEYVSQAIGGLADVFGTAFNNVLSIVSGVGGLILQAFDLINPWVRHSPSLVESVETGLQRIADAFAKLGQDVPVDLQQLGSAISAFREVAQSGLDGITAKADAALREHLNLIGIGVPEAYAAAEGEIADLRARAAEMSQTILEQNVSVAENEAVWRHWKDELASAESRLRTATAALDPLKDEVQRTNDAIIEQRVEVTRLELAWHAAELTLRPFEEAVKSADAALTAANQSVRDQESTIRSAEQQILDYGRSATLAAAGLDPLHTSFAQLGEAINQVGQKLTNAKQKLRELTETPLKGEHELQDQIFDAQTRLARAQLALNEAQARGAKGDQLKSYRKEIDLAQAAVERLQIKQRLTFDVQRRDLTRMTKPQTELDFTDASQQISGIMGEITRLEGLKDDLADIKNKEDERLGVLKVELSVRQNIVAQAQLLKDQAIASLNAEKDKIQPIQDQLNLAKDVLAVRQRDHDLAQQTLDQAELGLRGLKEDVTKYQSAVAGANTAWQLSKDAASDLKAGQGALITQANNWQAELANVAKEANNIFAENERERKAAEAERKRRAAEEKKKGVPRKPPGDRSEGFDPQQALRNIAAFQKQMEDIGTMMDQKFGPAVAYVNGQLESLVYWTGLIADKFRDIVGGASEILDSFGDSGLVGLLRDVVGAIPEAVLNFLELRAAIWILGAIGGVALGLLAGAVGFLLSPIGLVMAAVVALTTAWNNNWGDIQGKTAVVTAALGDFFENQLLPKLKAFGTWFTEDLMPALGETWTNLWENHIQPTGEAFAAWIENDLMPALDSLGLWWEENWPLFSTMIEDFWNNHAKPTLDAFGTFIHDDVIPALSAIKEAIATEILPQLGAFKDFITENLVPTLGTWKDFIGEEVLPRLGELKDFIGNDVLPQLASLKDWIVDTGIPALGQFKDFLGQHVIPKLGDLKDIIGQYVIPRLGDLKDWVGTNILPQLGKFKDYIGNEVIGKLREWKDFIAAEVLPKLGNLKDFILFDLIPAMIRLKEWFGVNVVPVIKTFIGLIGTLKDTMQDYGNFIQNVWEQGIFNAVEGVKTSIRDALGLVNLLIGAYNKFGPLAHEMNADNPAHIDEIQINSMLAPRQWKSSADQRREAQNKQRTIPAYDQYDPSALNYGGYDNSPEGTQVQVSPGYGGFDNSPTEINITVTNNGIIVGEDGMDQFQEIAQKYQLDDLRNRRAIA